MEGFDTARVAERRRPFDRLERRLVRLAVESGRLDDRETHRRYEALRYAIGFAKTTTVVQPDGEAVDLAGLQHLHARQLLDRLRPHLVDRRDLDGALHEAPDLARRALTSRHSLLDRIALDRDALEREVTTRQLVVASGGGGGAGYVYPGVYDQLDRLDLVPSLLVGTSIGALMSLFRGRRRHLDLAALVAAARVLSWSKVFRVLESENRYGLPATLRLYLHQALGELFQTPDDKPMWLSDMEIPVYTVVTGITVDALKHDLHYYEHLLDEDVRTSRTMRARAGLRAMSILREFLSNPEALKEIVIGRAAGTEDFDAIDAAGFSAAIPAVIHYDVLRDDPRMHRILDRLYASHGITRLGEGGMVSNVPARVAWESVTSGRIGPHRNAFVLALDCFAPSRRRVGWFPFQQLVRQSNVQSDRTYADLYVAFDQTLSPLNLVPSLPDALQAIRYGREAVEPYLPFIAEMMRPVAVLREQDVVAG